MAKANMSVSQSHCFIPDITSKNLSHNHKLKGDYGQNRA